jgi:hypothetical protein
MRRDAQQQAERQRQMREIAATRAYRRRHARISCDAHAVSDGLHERADRGDPPTRRRVLDSTTQYRSASVSQ